MFAEPLQDLVMVSDGWRLILTGSKVALQLQKEETGWLKHPSTATEDTDGDANMLTTSIKQLFLISQLAKPQCRLLTGCSNWF